MAVPSALLKVSVCVIALTSSGADGTCNVPLTFPYKRHVDEVSLCAAICPTVSITARRPGAIAAETEGQRGRSMKRDTENLVLTPDILSGIRKGQLAEPAPC